MKLNEKLAPYNIKQGEIMNKYKVTIIESAFEYTVKAESEEDAEYLAMQQHSSGSYDEVKKVTVKLLKQGVK